MVTDKLEQLKALRAKTAQLEQELAAEQNQALSGLPAQYGFDSVDAFIDAVRAAGGSRRGRRPGRRAKAPGRPAKAQAGAGSKAGAGKRGGRKPRAKITDETRAEVKKLVGQGKTGNEIATKLGISLPSVQNIKKALGLVEARKK